MPQSPCARVRLCYSCGQSARQVSRPCPLVVPISLYAIPSQLHHYLRHYKSGAYPRQQQEFSLKVISLLCHFLGDMATALRTKPGGTGTSSRPCPQPAGAQASTPSSARCARFPACFRPMGSSLSLGQNR